MSVHASIIRRQSSRKRVRMRVEPGAACVRCDHPARQLCHDCLVPICGPCSRLDAGNRVRCRRCFQPERDLPGMKPARRRRAPLSRQDEAPAAWYGRSAA